MSKLAIWLVTGILLTYFVFTSGLVFKLNTNKVIGSLDTPYSFALSYERTGIVGVFTKDDIRCAQWLAWESNQNIPIVTDVNGCLLLKSLIEDESRIDIPNIGRVTIKKIDKLETCYLFLTTWNTKHQKYIESDRLGAGLRAMYDLPTFNYQEVYRSGQAVVYLKGGRNRELSISPAPSSGTEGVAKYGDYLYVLTDYHYVGSEPRDWLYKINYETLTIVGQIEIPKRCEDMVIDEAAGMLYVTYWRGYAEIGKVNLNTFSFVGNLTLATTDDTACCLIVIGDYLYVSGGGFISKVSLATFIEVDKIDLPKVANGCTTANLWEMMDTDGTYLYCANTESPAKIVKIDLATFTQEGEILTLSVNDAEGLIYNDGYLYTLNKASPGTVTKVNATTMIEVGTITFTSGNNNPKSGYVHLGSTVYAECDMNPVRVVEVDLDSFTQTTSWSPGDGTGREAIMINEPDDGTASLIVCSDTASYTRIRKVPVIKERQQ